jgi:hypothetical protein
MLVLVARNGRVTVAVIVVRRLCLLVVLSQMHQQKGSIYRRKHRQRAEGSHLEFCLGCFPVRNFSWFVSQRAKFHSVDGRLGGGRVQLRFSIPKALCPEDIIGQPI